MTMLNFPSEEVKGVEVLPVVVDGVLGVEPVFVDAASLVADAADVSLAASFLSHAVSPSASVIIRQAEMRLVMTGLLGRNIRGNPAHRPETIPVDVGLDGILRTYDIALLDGTISKV